MTHDLKLTRLLGAALLAGTCLLPAAAQRVSVKTNALYWAAATPNLGLEFRLNRHLTLNLEGAFNKFHVSKIDSRMAGMMPEMRYWFSARPQAGHFVGFMGLVAGYDLTLNKTMHEGNAFAFGPTYGYSVVLSKHWSMEATIGVGALYLREKKYPTSLPQVPEEPNNKKWMPAPIKAGLTFVYIIK